MAIKKSKKYDANFTAGGILFNEFIALKEILLSGNFEDLIKNEEEENNFIGIATNSARKRIISEIKRRYNSAPENFWDNFFVWNEQEQKLALFYLCLKTYPIVFDLHFQVTVSKQKMGSSLGEYDIQMRLDEITSFNETVAGWSESTLKKINIQYRKALKDAGLYDGNNLYKPIHINDVFWEYFKGNNESWFLEACFI